MTKTQQQFEFADESKQERMQRLLSGPIGKRVTTAADLLFDYQRATEVAQRGSEGLTADTGGGSICTEQTQRRADRPPRTFSAQK